MSATEEKNTEKNIDTESPALFEYLRQEIPIDEIRDYSSPQRIDAIDFVKGFAIVMIILAHTAGAWFDSDWIYIYGMVYAALDILGPSLFVFLSALSVVFSVKNKKGRLPEKVIRIRIMTRGIVIMLIGMLYNLLAISLMVKGYPFPLSLWGWNILMFIGFSQIASYYALKLSKTARAFVGLIVIFVSPGIREMLYLGKDTNLAMWIGHYIVTSPAPQVTLLPWLAICFISTIFGEILHEAMIKGTTSAYKDLFRTFMKWGVFLVLVGLFLPLPQPLWQTGLTLQTEATLPRDEYLQIELLAIMNQQNYIKFPGMPLFMIRGTSSAMFYDLGAGLLIIALSFYFIDLKKKRNYFTRILTYYGKVSLSLFLLHYTFIPAFIGTFNIMFFPFFVVAYVALLGFLMFLWMESGGQGSPEWIMIQLGRVGQKTGETVKKEAKIAYEKTKEEAKVIVEKTKESIKKAQEFMKELSKKKPKKEGNQEND